MKKILLLFVMLVSVLAFATNPGGHQVTFNGTVTCPTGTTCTVNVYRSTSSITCSSGMTPTTNISGFPWEDDTVLAGTTYYYVFTTLPAVGGESNCSAQLQIAVSNTSASVPTVSGSQVH